MRGTPGGLVDGLAYRGLSLRCMSCRPVQLHGWPGEISSSAPASGNRCGRVWGRAFLYLPEGWIPTAKPRFIAATMEGGVNSSTSVSVGMS